MIINKDILVVVVIFGHKQFKITMVLKIQLLVVSMY